jgi:hypothetical protein
MTNISESRTRAQEILEALPGHVLRHAKTFHTYIRLFVDDTNTLKGSASGGSAEVSVNLRRLLDEVAALGGIGNGKKEEILQDPDARHVSGVFVCWHSAQYSLLL